MKMLQKMVAVVLGLCLAFCINVIPAFAMENNITTDTNTLVAKTAILNNIDEYGSNWGSDLTTDNACVVEDTLVSQSNNGDVITLNAYLNGQNVTITGTPLSKSENGNVTYFDGSVNNADYDVVLFSFEKEIQDSVVYFKGYMQENGKTDGNILKVYLKDNNSPTKDYIVLEVFDYELPFVESNLNSLEVDALPGAWVAEEFEPYETGMLNDPSKIYKDDEYTYTETYYAGDQEQIHTITVYYALDYTNIPVYSNGNQGIIARVTDKTITVPSAPNINSSSQSFLYVAGLTVEAKSIPNTAWYSAQLSGRAYSDIFNGLSVGVGVSLGVVNGSVSFPAVFENVGTINIDDNFLMFDNSNTNKRVRSFQTIMDSHYKLTQEGHNFCIDAALRDYGGDRLSNQRLEARWTFVFRNSHTSGSTTVKKSLVKLISIV